jgi:hypothetical protein
MSRILREFGRLGEPCRNCAKAGESDRGSGTRAVLLKMPHSIAGCPTLYSLNVGPAGELRGCAETWS